MDMAEFLALIEPFFTESVEWATSILNTITTSPALTVLCIGMPIVGFGVGLCNRLIRG